MSRSDDDRLCYDCELGWIDPADPMASLGIECEETTKHYLYRQAGRIVLKINKEAITDRLDFGKICLCVQDAEERYMTWQ